MQKKIEFFFIYVLLWNTWSVARIVINNGNYIVGVLGQLDPKFLTLYMFYFMFYINLTSSITNLNICFFYFRRDHWPIFSTFACWQHLVKETQSLSKDHAILADLYSISIVASLQTTIEDVQRIYKKVKL